MGSGVGQVGSGVGQRRAVGGEHDVAIHLVPRRGAGGVEVVHHHLVEGALVLHVPVLGRREQLVHPARGLGGEGWGRGLGEGGSDGGGCTGGWGGGGREWGWEAGRGWSLAGEGVEGLVRGRSHQRWVKASTAGGGGRGRWC